MARLARQSTGDEIPRRNRPNAAIVRKIYAIGVGLAPHHGDPSHLPGAKRAIAEILRLEKSNLVANVVLNGVNLRV
jgi:hypothetical protein